MRRVRAIGDLVAIALPLVLIGSVLAGVVSGVAFSPWCAVGFAALAVLVAVLIRLPRRRTPAPPADGGVTVLAVNLWYLNEHMTAAAADIVASGADVVVVSELSDEVHRVLADAYPYAQVRSTGAAKGHGVYARLPLTPVPGYDELIGPHVVVDVDGAMPFRLLGVHVPRPVVFERPYDGTVWLTDFRDGVVRLAELAAAHPDTVVAGDLNLCDRQPGYRRLVRGRLDAMRTGRARRTFLGGLPWRLLSLRIDHVVVPAGWRVSDARTVRITGSDHLGVTARLSR